jgi:curved DNA-binding protein CbpA
MDRRVHEAPGSREGGLYSVLDVEPGASPEAILHAYRRQARLTHPDARPNDPEAVARFRTLTDAYEVLSDPVLRADYDRARRGIRAASPVSQSGPRWPVQERPRRVGQPSGGGNSPEVFLDMRPPRPAGSNLWAGPVRVEASSRHQSGRLGRPQPPRGRGPDGFASLLLDFLAEWWSS